MGKKKPKDQHETTPQNDALSNPSSDIFKSLFGDAEQNATVVSSIFSDSNPFKRKPQEQNPEIDKPINNEKTEPNNQKLKKGKTQLDFEANEKAESGYEQGNENGKRRKKRKRDDVEREYEAKKNGTVNDDEEGGGGGGVVVGKKRKKADNAADILVSKEGEGFDDESKLLRTVFVGNLPLKVKKKALIKEFSHFGEIESVRIRSVPIEDTKIPRKGAIIRKQINDAIDSVHAYIVFKTEQSAKASLAHNMTMVGGNHIRVDRACPPRKKLKGEDAPLYDTNRTVFVGNLPFDVKDEEIYQLFAGIKDLESSIEAVRVIRHPNVGMGKGIAYVLFKTREAANIVVKKWNLKLRDRQLRLSHARKDSTPSKRKNPFSTEAANSPTKKFAVDSSTERNSGSKTKASLSYQGLRASKSGGQKKVHFKRNQVIKLSSDSRKGEKRVGKRPAVAARKAKANELKDAGASNHAGKKRKLDSQTPESSNQKKKSKKFR